MKVRKHTYTMDNYLKLMKDEAIRTDQECQRLSGQWDSNMVNELIATVLTDGYIPPVILGEEETDGITRKWIIDGLQRSSSLSLFRYGNTRITKNLDEPLVTYQRKALGADGNAMRDARNEIIWETATYDIRNTTYGQLPEELKDRFNGYQLEAVIHQECDQTEISKLVRRFNNHKAMNSAQKAFTYIDTFAREIRGITENRFFKDVYTCSRNDRKNGTLERVSADMVLLCNYPDQYKKDSRIAFRWLNENAALCDFEDMDSLLAKLTASVEAVPEIRALFGSKNAHVFVAAFREFLVLGMEDREFGKFLNWFVGGGNKTEIDGKTWEMLNADRSTRDAATVHGKIAYLVALARQYSEKVRKAA